MGSVYLPIYNVYTLDQNGVEQFIPEHEPVFSAHTGELIGLGNIPFGIPIDVPIDHNLYGNDYYIIGYNPIEHTWLAYGNLPDLVDE
ncbi:hypothetical protein HIRU_S689 [Hirudovirus strain Sangsue]|nr:hypothetical protein HIRU_S689 [Hirudovirus strain Sangsue]